MKQNRVIYKTKNKKLLIFCHLLVFSNNYLHYSLSISSKSLIIWFSVLKQICEGSTNIAVEALENIYFTFFFYCHYWHKLFNLLWFNVQVIWLCVFFHLPLLKSEQNIFAKRKICARCFVFYGTKQWAHPYGWAKFFVRGLRRI